MSNDDFRNELNRAFDDVAGTPSSNLHDRVRGAVAQAPQRREPYWIAGVAACVIAALIIGVLFVANPFRHAPSTVGVVHSPSPSSVASPQASPSASATAQPFVCVSSTDITQPTHPPVAYISALRSGTHTGYDRLTIEFANGAPTKVEIRAGAGTSFTLSPSGMQTTVKGKDGILIIIHGADLHTSYTGPTDIVTGYSGLAEVKRIEDFEGVVQLALGVNGSSCYREMWLTNPNRLVIDVQTP